MARLSNWESHIEWPDSDFSDYEKYFSDPDRMGFGDDPDEYEDVDVDEIVEEYYKMGPADPDYMEEVKRQWTPES